MRYVLARRPALAAAIALATVCALVGAAAISAAAFRLAAAYPVPILAGAALVGAWCAVPTVCHAMRRARRKRS